MNATTKGLQLVRRAQLLGVALSEIFDDEGYVDPEVREEACSFAPRYNVPLKPDSVLAFLKNEEKFNDEFLDILTGCDLGPLRLLMIEARQAAIDETFNTRMAKADKILDLLENSIGGEA